MSSISLTLWSKLGLAMLIGFLAMVCLAFGQQAQAANTISSAVYQDADANGTVDRIRWTMDENVTACAFEAGDWTVNTAGSINVAITGLTCTGSNTVLDINITTDANETGGGTNPVISYNNTDGDNSVTLTSGAMTAKANQSNTDAAAPTVVSTTPTSAATGTSRTTSVVLTFSEAMDTGFVEGTEFSMSPDPGAFDAAVWTVSDTVVTLDFPTLACGTTYTLTTTEAQIIASAGANTTLVTTGAQDGDWSFTTTSCGVTDSTPPVITSLTYTGTDCAVEGRHGFIVNGSNIQAVLSSSALDFPGALWVDTNIESIVNVYADLPVEAENAYLAFKSDSGMYSPTHSVALSDWTTMCVDEEEVEEDTDESEPATEDDDSSADSGSVTPVAGVSPGDLIVSSTTTTVYYVTEDYTRRVFLNEQTYFTWYSDFDDVMTVSADTLAALPLGPSMLPKAGVVLVKIISSPVVYALEASGEATNLREIPDEATAISLYGSAWADYVIDIEPTFFTKFGLDDDMSTSTSVDMDMMKTRVSLVAM